MHKMTVVLFTAIAAMFAVAPVAVAEETGLAGIHEQRREGNKICMSSHFHNGSSAGQSTRKLAEAAAARDWAGFTTLEYGSAWGSYRLAASKSMQCERSGAAWGCKVEARPCKKSRGRK